MATLTTGASLASGIHFHCFVLGFLHFAFYFSSIDEWGRLFLLKLVYVSSTTSNDNSTSSAAANDQAFLNSDWAFLNSNYAASTQALASPAPRRKPETIVLEESEKGEDACKICEEGMPKPIQVGNCLFKCELPTRNAIYSFPDNVDAKRAIKRQFATNDLDYYPDVYTDADRAANTKLRTSNF